MTCIRRKKCTTKNVYRRKYKYNTIYLDFVKLGSEKKCYCCFILGDLLFHFLLQPNKGIMGRKKNYYENGISILFIVNSTYIEARNHICNLQN